MDKRVPRRTFPPQMRHYLLFEEWAWSDPDVLARRRANWPAWRRAVRPIGAGLWWVCTLSGVVSGATWSTASPILRGLLILCGVGTAVCVVIGAIDGFKQRRNERRQASTGPMTVSQ